MTLDPGGRQVLQGRLLIGAATMFWGTSATLARYVFRDHHVPPLHAVEMRLLIAVTLLGLALAWRRPAALRIERRDWGYFLVLGLFGMAAVQGTYYYAIAVLGVGLAILLQYVAPSLIVVYDVVRGARVGSGTLGAVAAALIGTALLVVDADSTTQGASPLDWAIGFGAALSFAFYIVVSKRGLAKYAPETVLFYTFVIAGVFWTIVVPPWTVVNAGHPAGIWLAFVALGVLNTLVPFSLFYAGLKRLAPVQASIMATLEPVVAVLSAALLLGEGLRAVQWAGAVLVLAASVVASRGRSEVLPAQAERG